MAARLSRFLPSLAVLSGALLVAPSAQAQRQTQETFSFNGNCTDCREAFNLSVDPSERVNFYRVTGTLELAVQHTDDGRPPVAQLLTFRYNPTNLLPDGVYIDAREITINEQFFDYTGGTIRSALFAWDNGFFAFGIPASAPRWGDLGLDDDEWALCINQTPAECFADNSPINPNDYGTDGVFRSATTTVPEPSSVALIGAGLAALGFAHRRRSSQPPSKMRRAHS